MKKSLLILVLIAAGATFASAQNGGENGTIRATTTIHPDGSQSVVIYDPDKGTGEEKVSDSAGKLLRKVTYLLDEHNQAIGSITYDPKGTILYRATYKRDAQDRVDEEAISSANGTLIRRRVYTYGAQNKVTGITEYDANGNVISAPPKQATVSSRRRR
jgi:antitoxin component YwqK of YwqJK toxin-antitoxin module